MIAENGIKTTAGPRGAAGLITLICAAGLLVAAVVFATTHGVAEIPLSQILGIFGHKIGLPIEVDWEPWQAMVVWEVRLPRVFTGALVGAGLAISGVAMQGLFRNPLASPGVLGVSSGATVGAVLAIYLGLASQASFSVLGLAVHGGWIVPVMAVLGAGTTAGIVYAIATRRGRVPVGTLLLAGIALSSLNGALTSLILSLALSNYQIGTQIVHWTLGGLDGRTWDHVWMVGPAVLIGVVWIAAYARDLDALLLGETEAASVGVEVASVRRHMIAATSLVTGAAVAVSGTIAFIGLVIPHIMRALLGPGHRWLLPASMLAGAGFLVFADLFARTIIPPEEIRLGVITAAVGAPFFLFLLLRQRKEGFW